MGRPSRWSPALQATREQSEWVVRWIKDHGPVNTPKIVEALTEARIEIRAHVLQPALRNSPFIVRIATEQGPRGEVSVWAWSSEDTY